MSEDNEIENSNLTKITEVEFKPNKHIEIAQMNTSIAKILVYSDFADIVEGQEDQTSTPIARKTMVDGFDQYLNTLEEETSTCNVGDLVEYVTDKYDNFKPKKNLIGELDNAFIAGRLTERMPDAIQDDKEDFLEKYDTASELEDKLTKNSDYGVVTFYKKLLFKAIREGGSKTSTYRMNKYFESPELRNSLVDVLKDDQGNWIVDQDTRNELVIYTDFIWKVINEYRLICGGGTAFMKHSEDFAENMSYSMRSKAPHQKISETEMMARMKESNDKHYIYSDFRDFPGKGGRKLKKKYSRQPDPAKK